VGVGLRGRVGARVSSTTQKEREGANCCQRERENVFVLLLMCVSTSFYYYQREKIIINLGQP
jgi:hypothetical protein